MSKIAIITLADFNNYGNRLQNYALEKVLTDIGNEVSSIVSYRPNLLKEAIKLVVKNNSILFKEKVLRIRRLKKFLAFDKRYVNTCAINSDSFGSLQEKDYDCFFVGSDQVWNPDWANYTYEKMFLRFCPSQKRISYAASFGVDRIPEKWVKKYKVGLSEFNFLSVRERNAVGIVKSLTGRKCDVVLDPTLLLNKCDWDTVKRIPERAHKNDYILTYFLGEKPGSLNDKLLKYASLYHCRVINLLDLNDDAYLAGPDDFVGLISNAKLILTDSFHATVFSIIYERPFVVYNRLGIGAKMGSRIDSLLEMCGLFERRSEKIRDDQLLRCNFDTARKAIAQEQMQSINFIRKAVNGCIDSVD